MRQDLERDVAREVPTAELLRWLKVAVADFRTEKKFFLDEVSFDLARSAFRKWPTVRKSLNVSVDDIALWERESAIEPAKDVIRRWRDGKRIKPQDLDRVRRAIALEARPKDLGTSQSEMKDIIAACLRKRCEVALEDARGGTEYASVSVLKDEMEEAKLRYADLGTNQEEIKELAIKEGKRCLEKIEAGEDSDFNIGQILVLKEEKFISLKDIGLTEAKMKKIMEENDYEFNAL